jgi:CBS domain-containing protein
MPETFSQSLQFVQQPVSAGKFLENSQPDSNSLHNETITLRRLRVVKGIWPLPADWSFIDTIRSYIVKQRFCKVRGISTIEYLLIASAVSTVAVGAIACIRPFPGDSVTRINQALSHTTVANGPIDHGQSPQISDSAGTAAESASWPPATFILQTIFLVGLSTCGILAFNISRFRKKELQLVNKRGGNQPLVETHYVMLEKRTALQGILSRNWNSILKSELTVGEIMSKAVVSVGMDERFDKVQAMMIKKQIHHILVIDASKKLVGIVSDRDLGKSSDSTSTATDIMTPAPIAVLPRTGVKQAISMILRHRFSALPVVDENQHVCGILTSNDLLATLQCTLGLLFEISGVVQSETGAAIVQRELGDEAILGLTATGN